MLIAIKVKEIVVKVKIADLLKKRRKVIAVNVKICDDSDRVLVLGLRHQLRL